MGLPAHRWGHTVTTHLDHQERPVNDDPFDRRRDGLRDKTKGKTVEAIGWRLDADGPAAKGRFRGQGRARQDAAELRAGRKPAAAREVEPDER